MIDEQLIASTQLPRELRDLNATGRPVPRYPRLWQAMVDGEIPAERINGRWFVRKTDLAAIASLLGLSDPVSA